MPLQIGIVGLPNVGKSTLFNALIKSRAAEAQNYPFCTIDPNVGVVEVPDQRLTKLTELMQPEKVIPTAIEFVDIAGLVAGAHKGEGLGNKFLSNIRECDAICEVVRLFDDGNITHVSGSVDPKRDIGVIETELILADLESLGKRIGKHEQAAKTGNKESQEIMALVGPLKEALEAGKLASSIPLPDDKKKMLKDLQLLTTKPLIYAVNVAEEKLRALNVGDVQKQLGVEKGVILISAKIEQDLMDLSAEEAQEFLNDLGVASSGLDQLIRAAYELLGLITFFTVGPKEVRAWTVQKGATAPEAAGVIHTDFQKGFIRAETISYKDYVACGSESAAKEKGKMRAEGKEYVVQDGDVMHFRFNV